MTPLRAPPALERMALRVAKIRGRSKLLHMLVLADAMDEAGWQGSSIPTGRRGRERFDVHSLDVWGNHEDGYEINNWFNEGVLTVPTIEVLHNVRSARDAFMKTQDPHATRVMIASLFSSYHRIPGALERVLRRNWLASGVRRFTIDDMGGIGTLEVSVGGKPVLHLESRDY